MQNPSLQLQIQTLPDGPGVYQYYDKEGKILYPTVKPELIFIVQKKY